MYDLNFKEFKEQRRHNNPSGGTSSFVRASTPHLLQMKAFIPHQAFGLFAFGILAGIPKREDGQHRIMIRKVGGVLVHQADGRLAGGSEGPVGIEIIKPAGRSVVLSGPVLRRKSAQETASLACDQIDESGLFDFLEMRVVQFVFPKVAVALPALVESTEKRNDVRSLFVLPAIPRRKGIEVTGQKNLLGWVSLGQFARKQIHFPMPDFPMPGMEMNDVYPYPTRFA